MIVSLKKEGDIYVGKSKILSTDSGKLVANLIQDGVKLGMSTRMVGKLNKTEKGDEVSDMRLLAIDCVADPSAPTAFVNGILESKKYILHNNSVYQMEEAYDGFEDSLKTLPKKNKDEYVKNQLEVFFRNLAKYCK
jgi:CO dehydrogenase/acetyl-CoA synthase epsilon subunit